MPDGTSRSLLSTNLILVFIAILIIVLLICLPDWLEDLKPTAPPGGKVKGVEPQTMLITKRYCSSDHAFLVVGDKIRSDMLIIHPMSDADYSLVATERESWRIWASFQRQAGGVEPHSHCVVFDFEKIDGVADVDGPGYGLKSGGSRSFEVFAIEHEAGKTCPELLTDAYKSRTRNGCRATHAGGWQGTY